MIYLIPMFDCYILNKELTFLSKGAKYLAEEVDNSKIVIYGRANEIPFVLDFANPNKNILKFKHENNYFFFLFPHNFFNNFQTRIKFKSKELQINISSTLCVLIDGRVVVEQEINELKYSHYEIFEDVCLIYFEGGRNFLVVIKDEKCYFSNYYDEFNKSENEKYFMCKIQDVLNHGLVCKINKESIETYLVYLDDYELNLKEEFVPFVFLDCLKAGNFKYCNNLLSSEIVLESEKDIKNFFPEYDFFYPLELNVFALIKKNTLAGIYKFDVENNLIINIIVL